MKINPYEITKIANNLYVILYPAGRNGDRHYIAKKLVEGKLEIIGKFKTLKEVRNNNG